MMLIYTIINYDNICCCIVDMPSHREGLTTALWHAQDAFVGEWNLQSAATLLSGLSPTAAPSSTVTASSGRHLLYSFTDFLAAITNPQGTYQAIASANLQVLPLTSCRSAASLFLVLTAFIVFIVGLFLSFFDGVFYLVFFLFL